MEKFNNYIEKREIKPINTETARDHLNSVSDQYFEAINQCSESEFNSTINKLNPMCQFLDNPRSIVSVGIGRGLEAEVLLKLFNEKYGTKIIGLDLCDKALRIAKSYLDGRGLNVSFVQSSAVCLPFKNKNQEIDGMVYSAIMHEIYSYVEDGKLAWKKAIQEASESLSIDGVLLLRDFSAPAIKNEVKLSFLSKEAKEFYKYFRNRYRTFDSWNKSDADKIINRRSDISDYPEDQSGEVSPVPFSMIAEMMMHFKNYQSDIENKCIKPFDNNWKEIDECYLPPNPNRQENQSMDMQEYIEEVVACANEILNQHGQRLICLKSELSFRPQVAEFLKIHFEIKVDDSINLEDYYNQVSAKMELLFKKVQK